MDKIIESAWMELLAKAVKKQGASPRLVDDIDLYVPQSMLLALEESNRAVPRLIYLSAQESARRNAYMIVRKLGMPPDYFWKFEFWTRDRAFNSLAKIVHRIFSTIMHEAKEGKLEIKELNIDPFQIRIDFDSCAECSGINGCQHGICYYHAGTFAGIIAALVNQSNLDCFETSCVATGDEYCSFVLGDKSNKDFSQKFDAYISPPDMKIDLVERLTKSLKKDSVRSLGNMVNVNYLRLVTANILWDNPRLFALSNSEVGYRFGHNVANAINNFYGVEKWQALKYYYSNLRQINVDVTGNESELQITVKETVLAADNRTEMASFLAGELQGLASGLNGKEMALKESHFEGNCLVVTLVPKS